MDNNLYRMVASEVELIIRGVSEKLNAISKEQWISMELGAAKCKPSESDEETISWNQRVYCQQLLANEEENQVELIFDNSNIAKKRIADVMNFIQNQKVDFATLEIICYAAFSMMYIAMRNLEKGEIGELSQDICNGILGFKIRENEEKYLKKIWALILTKVRYTYELVEGEKKYEDKTEKAYRQEIKKILDDAYKLNPAGEIVELFKEIEAVDNYFRYPSDENLKRLRKNCFSKKSNWVRHIFTCDSLRMLEIDRPTMHYLPHITFCTSSDKSIYPLEKIASTEPTGAWWPEREQLDEKVTVWKERAYKQMLELPHVVNTEESQGELIYRVLDLLIKNEELEDTKNAIVSDFTHRYKNYEIDNIYNIAKALTEPPSKEELEEYRRELLLEYDNKQMMTREVVMLNLEHKGSFEELKGVIRKSVTVSDVEEGNIRSIVNEALKRVLLRILLVNNELRMEDIRNKYEEKGIDTFDLLDEYEEDILKNELDCVEWVNSKMSALRVEVFDAWKHLSFREFSEGNVFVMSLLIELFLNMLTYADISDDMNVRFASHDNGSDSYLTIETRNKVDYRIKSNSGKGLAARNRILSKINYGEEYKWRESILKEYSNDNSECTVTVRIATNVLGGRNEESNSMD